MHLVNVPTRDSKTEIFPAVKYCTIEIRAGSAEHSLRMGDCYLSEHLIARPDDLRLWVGRTIAAAIIQAREAGYRQALASVRSAIGIE
jgi:hypothetical protein